MKTYRTKTPLFRGTDFCTLAKVVFYSLLLVALAYVMIIAVMSEVGMK